MEGRLEATKKSHPQQHCCFDPQSARPPFPHDIALFLTLLSICCPPRIPLSSAFPSSENSLDRTARLNYIVHASLSPLTAFLVGFAVLPSLVLLVVRNVGLPSLSSLSRLTISPSLLRLSSRYTYIFLGLRHWPLESWNNSRPSFPGTIGCW